MKHILLFPLSLLQPLHKTLRYLYYTDLPRPSPFLKKHFLQLTVYEFLNTHSHTHTHTQSPTISRSLVGQWIWFGSSTPFGVKLGYPNRPSLLGDVTAMWTNKLPPPHTHTPLSLHSSRECFSSQGSACHSAKPSLFDPCSQTTQPAILSLQSYWRSEERRVG